ncbi:sprouty-related, EVH1 domain-containing protein 2-like isoform X2 [Branchiostoma floridae]|uniref:Sprouty-related, EVH1 domain-containing protein 2-like isoform X1 n=1 Tax=Branchiostoma floridae TaxID=7739 RepID=A0A9J7L2Y0_BRAFL|nr:sprouty-related, EVH1 domain-containing protein 2-like isoform X1 [Branchiostoma floridae]XP_035674952.1 sprouty-related, EVH1 domain-containing protein 2-like isoform X2 [Branchiostoma floridae]
MDGQRQFTEDNSLVRVRAQVMTRDDSSGGWLPLGGGGLSIVGVYSFQKEGDVLPKKDFVIYGERLKDKTVVLECTLRKDVQYNRVTPIFHHWFLEDKRFGLTFQSPGDARAFDRGIKRAVEDLSEESSPSSVPKSSPGELDEEDVFVSLDGDSSREPTPKPPKKERKPVTVATHDPYLSQFSHPHTTHSHLHRVHFITPSKPIRGSRRLHSTRETTHPEVIFQEEHTFIKTESAKDKDKQDSNRDSSDSSDVWIRHPDSTGRTAFADLPGHLAFPAGSSESTSDDADSYVHFSKNYPKVHDYSYPMLEPIRTDTSSSKSGKSRIVTVQPSKIFQDRRSQSQSEPLRPQTGHQRCVYCREMFSPDGNRPGSCEFAPDQTQQYMKRVSCMGAAEMMMYHCMSDAEGDYVDPCSCDTSDDMFCRRWAALSALTCVVPCLLCYPPLQLCYKCGIRCRCCGGRHKAV